MQSSGLRYSPLQRGICPIVSRCNVSSLVEMALLGALSGRCVVSPVNQPCQGPMPPEYLQHAEQLQGMSSPNNKSAMAMTAKAATHISWPTVLYPSSCCLHSSTCKYPGRKHGKQSVREHTKRLQMVPQSLALTQSPHGSALWA
jgi:hypothetical protein